MADLINRQDAMDAIPQRIKGQGGESWMMTYRRSGYNDCVDAYLDALRHLPSAEPELRHGKWIDNNGLYQCSVCKHIWSELWWTSVCPIDRMNKMMHYCPNCGAKMDEEGELELI